MKRLADGEPCGLVYNIQKYTIHDGPGIRTEIFFKGCPLGCLWCSNPEGMRPEPEIGVYPVRCMSKDKCSWCLKACPRGDDSPISFDEDGILEAVAQDAYCTDCLKCADTCPGRAIMVWGKPMTVAELMKVIEEDRSFYERSGGGVTLSGGEVMVQWEFASLLLKACKDAGIHTCVETTLLAGKTQIDAVLDYTDLLITDIKDMDSARHLAHTGMGNENILANIKYASGKGVPMVIRTPVVPGYNDDDENIIETGRFIKEELEGRVVQYQLLPYKKMGTEKYATLRRPYPMEEYKAPEREVWEPRLLALTALVKERYGIPVVAGSAEKLDI